jgi:hypothetical protein
MFTKTWWTKNLKLENGKSNMENEKLKNINEIKRKKIKDF